MVRKPKNRVYYKEKEQEELRHIAEGTLKQEAYKEKEQRHNVQGTRSQCRSYKEKEQKEQSHNIQETRTQSANRLPYVQLACSYRFMCTQFPVRGKQQGQEHGRAKGERRELGGEKKENDKEQGQRSVEK